LPPSSSSYARERPGPRGGPVSSVGAALTSESPRSASSERRRIRVAAPHSLAFAPHYLARRLGYFDDRSLTVEFVDADFGLAALDLATTRDIDIIVGNSAFLCLQDARDLQLELLGQCTQQCRYVIAQRPNQATGPFGWSGLQDSAVIFATNAPTPWIAFREALRQQSQSLDTILPICGLSTVEAVRLFVAGLGEYLVVDVETSLTAGLHEVTSLAGTIGPVPWSVYFAAGEVHETALSYHSRFLEAIDLAQQWIATHTGDELAEQIAGDFSSMNFDDVVAVAQRYRGMNLWPNSVAVDRDRFGEWHRVLQRWGWCSSCHGVV
jgi:NitT/TauT family transport system substrate-binding protein